MLGRAPTRGPPPGPGNPETTGSGRGLVTASLGLVGVPTVARLQEAASPSQPLTPHSQPRPQRQPASRLTIHAAS